MIVLDVRTALRSFRLSVTFTATVVATLALGIGATTAIFSIGAAVLLLVSTALAARYVPVRRALRMPPVTALRS
jgi:ABC-type antimicrobial peptide transport system permease subunit